MSTIYCSLFSVRIHFIPTTKFGGPQLLVPPSLIHSVGTWVLSITNRSIRPAKSAGLGRSTLRFGRPCARRYVNSSTHT